MKQDAILFKDEGEGGPVWVRRAGKLTNFKDSDSISAISGLPYAEWYTRQQARKIAKDEGLPFEEA